MSLEELRHILADVRHQLIQARSDLADQRSARYHLTMALQRLREASGARGDTADSPPADGDRK